MLWCDFYDGFWDWSDSTRRTRISSLEDIGSGDEVVEAVLEIEDPKVKAQLIRKAMRLGAEFSSDDFMNLDGELPDELYAELGKYAGFDHNDPYFDEDNMTWDDFECYYDYFGEASGEMLCNKLLTYHAEGDEIHLPPMGRVSPVFDFMSSIPENARTRFINYACYCIDLAENWDKNRIKYDLYLNKKYDLLFEKFPEDLRDLLCEDNLDLGALQFAFRSMVYDLGGFLSENDLVKLLSEVNHHLSHMDTDALRLFLDELRDNNRLQLTQKKLFHIAYEFVAISANLIPAIGVLYYSSPNSIDKEHLGISTCSFEEIKNFYQDTFESLVDGCDIILGLDNIENRGSYNSFSTNISIENFRKQRKGNRVQYLKGQEFFEKKFDLPTKSSSLRNAIGHSDYEYDGVTQEIRYKEKEGSDTISTTYLVDVALECCKMMRSTLMLAFVVYDLMRYDMRDKHESIPLHPIMYKNVKTQSFCPCGSKKKYKHCCKNIIDQQAYSRDIFDYPMRAEFQGPSIEEWIKKFKRT